MMNIVILATLVAASLGVSPGAFAQSIGPEPKEAGAGVPLLGFGSGARSAVAGLMALESATAWLDGQRPLPAKLQGKIVLVDFGTYTCINWLRHMPYVRSWAERYGPRGLVVIGIHTPEFDFEKNLDNVRAAIRARRIDYPVAIDNDYALWRAFDNRAWPAHYLIDGQGRIRHRTFGEGSYEETETAIRNVLEDAGKTDVDRTTGLLDAVGVEAPADWGSLRSAENYLGYGSTQGFSSPGGIAADQSRTYALPAAVNLNGWALSGDWTVGKDAALATARNGRLTYRFHARDLHLVMGPAVAGQAVRFTVRIDGRPPGMAHGVDSDPDGNGTLDGQRLYQLIRQGGAVEDRLFEIEFKDPGAQLFAFTFG